MTDVQQPAPTNSTEARAALDSRMADESWRDQVFAGDVAANKELHELTAMASRSGDDTVTVAMHGHPALMPTSDMAAMSHTAALFRDLGIRDEVTAQFLSGKKVSAAEYQMVSSFKKELMGDTEWVKKYLSGDVKANEQMTIVNSVLVNGMEEKTA